MLVPISMGQARASREGRLPDPDPVREGVWSLPLRMPGSHTPYSLCYVFEDSAGAVHVIDPGVPSASNWEALQRLLGSVGHKIDDVATVTATHMHPDHLGLAARLRDASGAAFVLHERESASAFPGGEGADTAPSGEALDEWGVPAERRLELELPEAFGGRAVPEPDVTVTDGQVLPVAGRSLMVIATPGHTSGHMCVRDAENALILTGDHVLPVVHPGLGLGRSTAEDPVQSYLESLKRVAEFDDDEVAPGHEYRFRGLAERSAASAEHHLRRTREVACALGDDDALDVWSIASRMTWTAGWEQLSGFFLMSALAQTAMHMRFVRSGAADGYL